jgi:MFS transporter, PAT family, beta-lactamase induction signal transducer AmpG
MDVAGRRGGVEAWRRSLATYAEPRLIAVLFMGFSSGLPLALTTGTLQVWQTRAGVSLATIGFFALVGAVYSLKFVWAPLMDQIRLPGPLGRLGRRRGWAIVTQLALAASLLLLGTSDPAAAPALTAFFAVLVAFSSASQDIVIDAYRIELLDEAQQGAGAAMTQYGYRIGMLVSGAGALFLAGHLSWSAVYAVMAVLVAVGIVTVLLTREPAQSGFAAAASAGRAWRLRALALAAVAASAIIVFFVAKLLLGGLGLPGWVPNTVAVMLAAATPVAIILLLPRPDPTAARGPAAGYAELRAWLDGAVVRPFAEFASRRGWLAILLFIVLFKLGDAVAGVMANPFYVKIGFSNEEIASVTKVFGLIATLVGVFIGGTLVARLGIMRALLVSGLLQMVSNLTFSAQAEVGHSVGFLIVTIGVENLAGGIGSAAFVAYLSGLCNVAFTATQYALFSSLAVVGRTVLSAPGGVLAERLGWFDYFLASTALAIPGLLVLVWMMRRYPVEPAPPR